MAVSLRRVYLYLAIAGALSAVALALVRVLHPLLWILEVPDTIDWIAHSLGQFVAVPLFNAAGTPPPRQQVLAAFPLLLVTLAVAVPWLALHYWLLRREERRDPAARGAALRVVLLDLMTIGFGAVVVSSATQAAAAWLQAIPGHTLLVYSQLVDTQASSLSYALAFAVPFLLTALERHRTRNPSVTAQRISWSLYVLPQVVLLVEVVEFAGGALQEVMQAFAQPASLASCFTGRVACLHGGAIFTTTNSLGQGLVVVAAFAGAVYLTRKDAGSTVGVIRSALLVGLAMFFTIMSLGLWLSNFLTFEMPYLGLPEFPVFNVLTFEYGVLLAAVGALAWSALQAWHQASRANRAWARRTILVAASLPPLGALALGLENTLAMAVASVGGAYFNDQAHNIALGQLSAALPLLVTIPLLARDWHWPHAVRVSPRI